MGLNSGGLIIGRTFASEIWGAYFQESFFWGWGGGAYYRNFILYVSSGYVLKLSAGAGCDCIQSIHNTRSFQISNIVTIVTDRKSSKLVVLLTGMVSLIYALANPIIYGKMSMRYRWAYKRVFGAACGFCGQKPRSWSISFSSISE